MNWARRDVLGLLGTSVAAMTAISMTGTSALAGDEARFTEVASGLRFPEGPIAMPDGSLILVEIESGHLTRIDAVGNIERLVYLGGGPNGAALGPDGRIYVCNNGGFNWDESSGLLIPVGTPESYDGGRIEVVDLETRKVETLYTSCNGRPLRGPNDLVFDKHGGFWFTDHGKSSERQEDITGVYYAKADGSFISEPIFPLHGPNGLGLSPDEKTLYVAETLSGRIWNYSIIAPGKIAPQVGLGLDRLLYTAPGGYEIYDSLAIDAQGNIAVASLVTAGVRTVSPQGKSIDFFETGDLMTTNICFGGKDLKTAYITLSGTGRVVKADWPRGGKPLNHLNS